MSPPTPARDWLAERGREDDELLFSTADYAMMLGRKRIPRTLAIGLFTGDVIAHRSELRRRCSTPTTIGSVHADRMRILARIGVCGAVRRRVAVGILTTVAGVLLGLGILPAVLVGVAASTLRSSIVLGLKRSVLFAPVLIGIPAAGFSLFLSLDHWWLWTFTVTLGTNLYFAFQVLALLQSQSRGNPFGFVPFRTRVRMISRGRWGSFTVGIDKAMYDESTRAELFLAHAEPAVPDTLRPALLAARAVIASRQGAMDLALELLADAGAAPSPTRMRGWIDLARAEVFVLAGRGPDADAAFASALSALDRRRDEAWYDRASAGRITLGIQQGADPEELVPLITAYRWRAIARNNTARLSLSETWVLRLMLAVGNEAGALHLARAAVMWVRGSAALTLPATELAGTQLLLAQILLTEFATDEAARVEKKDRADAQEHLRMAAMVREFEPEYASPESTDDDLRTKSNAQLAVDLGFSALDALRSTDHPLAEAAARLTIGRGLLAVNADDALAHTLAALRTIQTVRYRLPASAWRGNWEALHASAFALALSLAAQASNDRLIAELLEGMRSQAVPRTRDPRAEELFAVLDAFIFGPEIASDDPDADGPGVDPLGLVPTITIDDACWSAPYGSDQLSLEKTVDAIADGAWYWSGALVGENYFWALRDQEGAWSAGRTGLDDSSVVEELLLALPVPLPTDGTESPMTRALGGVLGESLTRGGQGSLEVVLLERVATMLLPDALRADLLTASRNDPRRLLVALLGDLAVLPVVGWPLDDSEEPARVIERACVSHVPSIALLASSPARPAAESAHPIAAAVVVPHESAETPESERLPFAAAPPADAIEVLSGPVLRDDLEKLLARLAASGGEPTLYVAGHVDAGRRGEPASGGLRLAGGERLSSRDLLRTDESGARRFPMPRRVVVAACASLGIGATSEPTTDGRHAVEWLGFAAGVISAGAADVIATLYPIPEFDETRRFDHAVAERMSTHESPAHALREVQLAELDRRRAGRPARPLVWQAYAHVGSPVSAD